MEDAQKDSYLRWRLLLGEYSERGLGPGCQLSAEDLARGAALDWLYSREYSERGVRGQGDLGGNCPTQLSVPKWVGEVRRLFPKETVELVQKHALERYGLKELVTDPEILETLEPNLDLAATLLSFSSMLSPRILEQARRIIRAVTRELQEKLREEMQTARHGMRRSGRERAAKELRNLDLHATIMLNLKYWDPEKQRLGIRELRFFPRGKSQMSRRVILCVDQSGSMAYSLIHSAVMASILSGINHLQARLIVFDTSVVDLSSICEDPVEVLMSAQLGGGTDIGQALQYAEQQVEDPSRSVVVLVSDFFEGGDPSPMFRAVKRMKESGVKLLGLAALDQSAEPRYCSLTAEQLCECGMPVAALTPDKLAPWLIQEIC